MVCQDHDGFLDADDLRKSLGNSADVDQLIKAADTNGDGKASGLPIAHIFELQITLCSPKALA